VLTDVFVIYVKVKFPRAGLREKLERSTFNAIKNTNGDGLGS